METKITKLFRIISSIAILPAFLVHFTLYFLHTKFWPDKFVYLACAGIVTILLLLLLSKIFNYFPNNYGMSLNIKNKDFLYILLFFGATVILWYLYNYLIGIANIIPWYYDYPSKNIIFEKLIIIAILIVLAFVEEFLFRGYLLNIYLEKLNPVISVIITLLISSIYYAMQFGFIFAGFMLLYGILLSVLYILKKNIILTTLLHILGYIFIFIVIS
ncbi:MAG: hypothetical protein A2Y34_01520 [Spirochaetes bacterium GWC1_27_15]|nr:MAG: hypothetical protein A2Z98_07090 [Spirochaetes bacterium GWB1_27_13]OHD21508.1 MAG: hypothetical protein A2Y34_01520 [Spirochaetes bacterium GWC1_27_15]